MSRRTLSTALALVMIAVFASVAVLAIRLRQVSGVEAIARCAQSLEVVADDGALLPAMLYRCERAPGRSAGIVVWPREPGAAAGWAGGLSFWARQGRAMLVLTAPRRPGRERADLVAAIEALADEPSIDPGRIGVALEGPPATAVLDPDGAAMLPPAAAAAVIADPPSAVRNALAGGAEPGIALLVAKGGKAPSGAIVLDRRWLRLGRPSLAGSAARAAALLRDALDVTPHPATEPEP